MKTAGAVLPAMERVVSFYLGFRKAIRAEGTIWIEGIGTTHIAFWMLCLFQPGLYFDRIVGPESTRLPDQQTAAVLEQLLAVWGVGVIALTTWAVYLYVTAIHASNYPSPVEQEEAVYKSIRLRKVCMLLRASFFVFTGVIMANIDWARPSVGGEFILAAACLLGYLRHSIVLDEHDRSLSS